MGMATTKRFETPDETRDFEHGRVDMVRLAGAKAAQSTFGPGWRWSTDIKPVVGTDSCQAHHVGVIVSGTMHVVHNDGTEADLVSGAGYVIGTTFSASQVATAGRVRKGETSSESGASAKPSKRVATMRPGSACSQAHMSAASWSERRAVE